MQRVSFDVIVHCQCLQNDMVYNMYGGVIKSCELMLALAVGIPMAETLERDYMGAAVHVKAIDSYNFCFPST